MGAVAQLGERGVRNAEVGSSILLRSTNFLPVFDLNQVARRLVFVDVGPVSGRNAFNPASLHRRCLAPPCIVGPNRPILAPGLVLLAVRHRH